ncbi:putative Predicted protein [uncultured delta proteobacterium]|uniref:Uncharacterized protein n=1 Tax=uncultured delta proteobacterium TaxID=34034 RepID=A0A212JVB7_9DELT|nr:putative Predicted protein [uncultured delta proteobacterium]
MSENANNIPLDDEDILDLTVVAEPGKPAVKTDGPPEMGDSDGPVDFGADLDALLDSLGADGTVTAPAAKAATAKPVAAPIADQTPVDHTVDPDEEMAMPEMSDIDSLLAELGAEIPAVAEASAPAPEPKAAAPMAEFDDLLAQAQAAEAEKAKAEAAAMAAEMMAGQAAPKAPAAPAPEPKAAAPMAEFDDLLAQAQAAEAAKAKEEAAAMMADMMADQAAPAAPKVSPVPNMVGMEEEFAAARPAQDGPSTAIDARAVLTDFEDVPDAVETAGQAAAQTAPNVVEDSAAEYAADPAEDALDLNELDALLDDILATAPEMGSPAAKASPAPTPAPGAALAAQAAVMAAQAVSSPRMESVADVIPVPDQAIMPVSEDVAALAERVSRLEEADFAALNERLQRLEESVDVLESEEVSEAMMEGFINAKVGAKLESLFIPDSPVMERICEEIRARLAEGYFNESLEKMAAAAAAKVIREEIAALMQENG